VLTCYIDTPADLRYQRWLEQQHSTISAESLRRFQWHSASPAQRHVYQLRHHADQVLDGSQPAETLAATVEKLIGSAGADHHDAHQ
jgi:hypothetical protein